MSQTGLIFLLFVSTMSILAVARHPIYGVSLYMLLVFLDPGSRWWGADLPDLRWSFLSIAFTVVGLLIHKPRPQAIPVLRQTPFVILLTLLSWSVLQLLWVPDTETHLEYINYLWKYALALYLMYRCADSQEHVLGLLWTFVLGCAYLAWVAHNGYRGGRFNSFGGNNIGEANAGALTLVCGMFVASSLFLISKRRGKLATLLAVPFFMNAMIMTISRSGFLAFAVGGLTFAILTPRRIRRPVVALSLIAVSVFFFLTGPEYWQRVETVKYAGAEVKGLDTGAGRLDIMEAQVRMFRDHPLGCGHSCTHLLSGSYLDPRFLSKGGSRSSHNTFLSMLVDHGVVGGALYLLLAAWAFLTLRSLIRHRGSLPESWTTLVPGVAASVAALLAADQFVPYVRYEVRYWLLGFVMILFSFSVHSKAATHRSDEESGSRNDLRARVWRKPAGSAG